MNNKITNDMFLATVTNPEAKTYDFLNNDVIPENTQLKERDFYKNNEYIKEKFQTPEGKFDNNAFENAYSAALSNFNQIADDDYIKKLDEVKYDPFTWSKPKEAKVWDVDVKFSTDYNPYKQLYSRDHVNSITESNFSLREIAQKGRVYDLKTDSWSESANKLGLFQKFFGDTLVYAQWDDDGVHVDPVNGQTVNHKKGDWKVDETGSLHLEKLGDREVYGKQVVNPSDILTTDGSAFNRFDFFDADGREKSIGKTAMKTIVEIVPLLIPFGVNTVYGGTRAAIGLASVLPTFYKSLEGLLLGDSKSALTDPVSKAEGFMAKFSQQSTSDEGTESMWNFEQMSSMVTSIFSQIYEQRAMAGLSKMLMRPDKLLDSKVNNLKMLTARKALPLVDKHNINLNKAINEVVENTPEIKAAFAKQSQLSKALSLGYMALTSTGDVYGEAVESGYDRRTAGFASLLTASGQYGIMMNNPMGDWFLDKTTGYNMNVNRSLMKKSIKPWLKEISEVFNSPEAVAIKRNKLAQIAIKFKRGMGTIFDGSSTLVESMWKNSVIEGIEEVTEQVVQDATKGMIDVMNYLGLTKGKGDFRSLEKYTSGEAFQEYLANFVGGVLGGGLFELERSEISPWIANKGKISPEVRKEIYELVANGNKEELIKEIKRQGKHLASNYLSTVNEDGQFVHSDNGVSHADIAIQKAIEVVEQLDVTFNSGGTNLTDEEIMNKAIRTQVFLSEFDKYKTEGKHVGLEGLVITDFRNNALKISEVSDRITELKKDEDTNKAQIKLEQENLKPLIAKRDKILNGEYGMEYFDRITVALNPYIKDIFVSLDRQSYIKAKYNMDYTTLSESGEGLTKKSANTEWEEFLDNTDIMAKLEYVTKGYKELEKILNKPIGDYVGSGYDVVRSQVQKHILDLDRTIAQFNTSTDQNTKQNLLNNFISINNSLEQLGLTKVAPWTVINYDNFEQLKDLGLLKKSVITTNALGEQEEILEDYTDSELNTIQSNGNTLLENIKEDFNSYSKFFPTNPLNIGEVIAQFNSKIIQDNQENQVELDKLLSLNSTDQETLDQIAKLQESIKNVRIGNLENTTDISNESIRVEGLIKKEIGNILHSYQDKEIYDKYKEALNNRSVYDKSFSILLTESGITNTDFDSITDEDLIKFLQKLDELGILDLAKEEFSGKEAEKVFNEIESGIVDRENVKEIFNFLKSNIDRNNSILSDKKLIKLHEFVLNEETAFSKFIEENKPEFFKLRNVAFDFLLDAIKKEGYNDKELYNLLKDMFNRDLNSFFGSVLPGFGSLNYDEMMQLLSEDMDEMYGKFATFVSQKDYTDIENMTLGDIINNDDFFFDNEFLRKLLRDNFTDDKKMLEILPTLESFQDRHSDLISSQNSIPKFLEYEKTKSSLKSNPLYDFIRKFTLTLNSNPENKVNKIFELLEKEENLFRASSGASNYTADNIREADLQQAVNTLDMITAVINAMSTTSYYGDDANGFIAMRQRFARESNLPDEVLDLVTIDSDQAAIMTKDIQSLRVRLQFIKDLAITNGVKLTAEHETIRNNMTISNASIFEHLYKNISLAKFIPKDFEEIFENQKDPEKKLIELEESFYKHNKNQKVEALEALLKFEFTDAEGQRVSVDRRTNITKDTKREEITPYMKVNYLTMVLATSAKDEQIKYLDTLTRLNKASFYMQEIVSRMTNASIQEPELFAKLYELKPNDGNDYAEHMTFVLGGAGTGKTTVVVATVLDMVRQSNNSSKIWLGAPNKDQSVKFLNDVTDSIGKQLISFESLDKQSLFEAMGSKIGKLWNEINTAQNDIRNNTGVDKLFNFETTNRGNILKFNLPSDWDVGVDFSVLPNALFIDEITHFSKAEVLLLNAISKKSLNSGNFMKIVGLGDPNQMGFQIELGTKQKPEYITYNINALNATFTPTLMTTIRATNDQKRINNDFLLNVSNKSSEIFNKHNRDKKLTVGEITSKANSELRSNYLNDIKQNIGLKYYLGKEGFRGDYIQKNPKDISVLKNIKESIDLAEGEKPTFNILTQSGKLDINTQELLESVGITPDYYTLYTVNNIQGSEADYFMYDVGLIKNYDKDRDFIKALYTYTSRSKIGTLITDFDNKLEQEYNITNAERSKYFVPYDPLTKGAIDTIKAARVEKINSLIEGHTLSSDQFKWRGKSKPRQPAGGSGGGGSGSGGGSYGSGNLKINTTVEKFEPFFHGFYNNTNVVITNEVINVNNASTPTDLNGLKNSKKENTEKIISDWGNLKSNLLHDIGIGKLDISDLKYHNYFKHIFPINPGDIGTIDVEFVITLSKYNKSTNSPYLKFGRNPDAELENTDPFINLSAKLTYGGKVHYVTLANFSKESTILNAIMSISVEGLDKNKTDEVNKKKKELADKVANTFIDLKKKISNFSSSDIIEISNVTKNDLTFLTSTRFIQTEDSSGKLDSFNLTELFSKFLGIKVSEIRIFPGNEADFRKVYDGFVFGEKYDEEFLKEKYNEWKNKPYVVISYANDLNGSTGNNSSAKPVVLISTTRNISTLEREATEIYEEETKHVRDYYKIPEKDRGKFVYNPVIDAKNQMLLDKPQILDILIKWGSVKDSNGKSILERLIEDIASGTETVKIIDLINVFSEDKDSNKLLQVMQEVIDELKSGVTSDTKGNIIKRIDGITFWDDNFNRFFAYKNVLKDSVARKNIGSEVKQKSELLVLEALNTLKDMEFYYNIPIGVKDNKIVAKEEINGSQGFSSSLFHNKFVIQATPEPERVSLSLNKFFNLDLSKSPTSGNSGTPGSSKTPKVLFTRISGKGTLTVINEKATSGLYEIDTVNNTYTIHVTPKELFDGIHHSSGNLFEGLVDIEGDINDFDTIVILEKGTLAKGIDRDWNINKPIKIKVSKTNKGSKTVANYSITVGNRIIEPLAGFRKIVDILFDNVYWDIATKLNVELSAPANNSSDYLGISEFFKSIGIQQPFTEIRSPHILGAFQKLIGNDTKVLTEILNVAKDIAKDINECK